MSKTYNGPIKSDTNVTIIHGKSVPKQNKIGGHEKKYDMTEAIRTAKIDNEERGLTKITREFAQALVDNRKKRDVEGKAFTQQDLATQSGVSIELIRKYETVDAIVDPQFHANCEKIKRFFKIDKLPRIVPPKLTPV